MIDVSRTTISRAENKTAAALIMSARQFFTGMKYEFETSTVCNEALKLAFYSYRQDATNHRNKKCTLELDASYGIVNLGDFKADELDAASFDWDKHFCGIRRVSDVLPIEDESGAGALGFTQKALRSLGCPEWEQATQDAWTL